MEINMISIHKATIEDFEGISRVLEEVDVLHRNALPGYF